MKGSRGNALSFEAARVGTENWNARTNRVGTECAVEIGGVVDFTVREH